VQYFAWGVDRPDAMEQRLDLRDAHWAFLDRSEDRLFARCPVLDDAEPTKVLSSIHVVELDDDAEARHFAYDEPFAKEGVFSALVLSGYRHELSRTQLEFESNPDAPRFFVHCPAAAPGTAPPDDIASGDESHCAAFDSHVVCRGSLIDEDGFPENDLSSRRPPAAGRARHRHRRGRADPYRTVRLRPRRRARSLP
jgi:uncharacterized protein YciI